MYTFFCNIICSLFFISVLSRFTLDLTSRRGSRKVRHWLVGVTCRLIFFHNCGSIPFVVGYFSFVVGTFSFIIVFYNVLCNVMVNGARAR